MPGSQCGPWSNPQANSRTLRALHSRHQPHPSVAPFFSLKALGLPSIISLGFFISAYSPSSCPACSPAGSPTRLPESPATCPSAGPWDCSEHEGYCKHSSRSHGSCRSHSERRCPATWGGDSQRGPEGHLGAGRQGCTAQLSGTLPQRAPVRSYMDATSTFQGPVGQRERKFTLGPQTANKNFFSRSFHGMVT